MRHVPRGMDAAPESLAKRGTDGLTELERASNYFIPPGGGAAPDEAFDFSAYKGDDVKVRLDKLFHGKCAYCESFYSSTAPVDVEHFRPKGAIDGEPNHRGYWWLAAEWTNLLPSCIDCNRRRKQPTPRSSVSLVELLSSGVGGLPTVIMNTGKKDCFPIPATATRATLPTSNLQAENAFLLNPCIDKPEDEIQFHLDPKHMISLVFPKKTGDGGAVPHAAGGAGAIGTAGGAVAAHAVQNELSLRGAISIQVYGLNRLGLVQQRTRVLRHLEFLGSLIIDLATLRERVDGALQANPAQPLLLDVSNKLIELRDRIYGELGSMKEDTAPHAAMVSAWLESFKKRIADS